MSGIEELNYNRFAKGSVGVYLMDRVMVYEGYYGELPLYNTNPIIDRNGGLSIFGRLRCGVEFVYVGNLSVGKDIEECGSIKIVSLLYTT